MIDVFRKLREKKPKRAFEADYGNSRRHAIHLHCIDCAGSSREAKDCQTTTCFLWPYRPGAVKGEERSDIPTVETYEKWISESQSEAQIAHGQRLAAVKRGEEVEWEPKKQLTNLEKIAEGRTWKDFAGINGPDDWKKRLGVRFRVWSEEKHLGSREAIFADRMKRIMEYYKK